MSTMKLTRLIAVALAGSIAVSASTTALAKSHDEPGRGQKTYLPGEGGCKDEMIFWSAPCS
jgi:hypothetical protein